MLIRTSGHMHAKPYSTVAKALVEWLLEQPHVRSVNSTGA